MLPDLSDRVHPPPLTFVTRAQINSLDHYGLLTLTLGTIKTHWLKYFHFVNYMESELQKEIILNFPFPTIFNIKRALKMVMFFRHPAYVSMEVAEKDLFRSNFLCFFSMRLFGPLLMLCYAVQASPSPALTELYRSVVMDHFLHRYDRLDPLFSQLGDGDFKHSSKRGLETDKIMEPFKYPVRAGTISPFVDLGTPRLPHHQTQFTFSDPKHESLFAPVTIHNEGSVTSTSSPSLPLPVSGNVQDQQIPSAENSQFAMRPFTFFNIPGLVSQPIHHGGQYNVQHVAQHPPQPQLVGQEVVVQTNTGKHQQDLLSETSRDLNHVTTKEGSLAYPATPSVFQAVPLRRTQFLPVAATSQNQISQSPIIEQKFPPFKDDIITNIVPTSVTDTNDKQFNIFEYISRPTSDRRARQKVSPTKMSKMGKMDALKILMKIAGDDWEKDLVMGAKEEHGSISSAGERVSFQCPAEEGNFPDSGQCDVYYQCAGGRPHRYSCHSGLQWNIAKNLCDWAETVDCSLNKTFYSRATP